MNTNTNNSGSANASNMKATVFNLIILDESGSMSGMTKNTISGCNETLNIIRSNAQTHADTMRNLVSIYAFQDGGPVKSRYIIKNAKPEDVKDITDRDYRPWGNTPLLDAIGSTLSELKAVAATHEDATGIITIMTDGYENSSTQYSYKQVARLITQFREMGWTVNLIGANIDVDAMARSLNIVKESTMKYTQDENGTKEMWDTFSSAVSSRLDEEAEIASSEAEPEARIYMRKSGKFFKR